MKNHVAVTWVASLLVGIGIGIAAPVAGASIGPGISLSPVSQQNAVRAANQYLSVMPFSRDGLIRQLVDFDGYSTADATLAVDSVTVDWNEQAAKSANQYLSVMPFSRDGLLNQLVSFDGYTYAQAAYGVATTGL